MNDAGTLIGTKGANIKTLQSDTGCAIRVLKADDPRNDTGNSFFFCSSNESLVQFCQFFNLFIYVFIFSILFCPKESETRAVQLEGSVKQVYHLVL
jgi:hypothetical protein